MARKSGNRSKSASSENESAATSQFAPSPLPTPLEHATLAARILAHAGHLSPQDSQITKAVATAARIWAAVIEHPTERVVEETRLALATDRGAAETRWHQWQNRQLNIEQEVADETEKLKKWRERVDRYFHDLPFPATADDVIQRIMGGKSNQGKSRESRRREFSTAWLKSAEAIEKAHWEFIRSNLFRLPGEHDVISDAMLRHQESSGSGQPAPLSQFTGRKGAETLRAEVAKRQAEFLNAEEDQIKARHQNLVRMSQELQSRRLDKTEAAQWLRLWTKFQEAEKQRKGGEATKNKHATPAPTE